MTNIDFDELDKAVNSLMNKQQGGDTKEDNVSTGQAEVPSVASQTVPTPVVDEPMQATSLTDSLFGSVSASSVKPKSEADVVDATPGIVLFVVICIFMFSLALTGILNHSNYYYNSY